MFESNADTRQGQRQIALLIDGPLMTYKAYFALPKTITNAEGDPINAAYGIVSILLRLVSDYRPDYVVMAWDSPRPFFRDDMYPEYKAGRFQLPADLVELQVPLARAAIEVLAIPLVAVPKYEADDVIASYATQFMAQNVQSLVITGDRDALQLVEDPYVRVLLSQRGVTKFQIYDEAQMLEEFGFAPDRYVDYVALKGDPSDNIRGLAGIGAARARSLIAATSSFGELTAHPMVAERLHTAQGGSSLAFNAELLRLVRDLEVPAAAAWSLPRPSRLASLDDMGMAKLRERAETLGSEQLRLTDPAADE